MDITLIRVNEVIDGIASEVKSRLSTAEPGHDWLHVERVWDNARQILAHEALANEYTVTLAVLLHDIADSKFFNGDEQLGLSMAQDIMTKHNVQNQTIDEVLLIIDNMSYKGGFKKSNYDSLELMIVKDADRLDAIGAIGIARAFTFGGHKNRRLYDKSLAPVQFDSRDAYKFNEGTTINHFFEKLFKLKDLMHTDIAKKMALERHQFMNEFVHHFYHEAGMDKNILNKIVI